LARLAETLLPLHDEVPEQAVEKAMTELRRYPETHDAAWTSGMRTKVGLPESVVDPDDERPRLGDLLTLLHANRVDYPSFFRALGDTLEPRADATAAFALRTMFSDSASLDAWLTRWRSALSDNGVEPSAAVEQMRRANPVYVPRNHRVEEVLAAATDGDVSPAVALVDCLRHPFTRTDECRGLESPAPEGSGTYRTFCGT
ncbi:MAG: protein adenylyltransferase SelO family protein, partial [Ilumatobacteraceae bacterium]